MKLLKSMATTIACPAGEPISDLLGYRRPSPSRMPVMDHLFLWLVMIVAGTVTMPQVLATGEASGLGQWTSLIVLSTTVLWGTRPYFPRKLFWVLGPLVGFNLFACLSMTWGGILPPSLQILSVGLALPGLVLVAARECERDPRVARMLHRTLDFSSLLAGVVYTVVLLRQGPGGEMFVNDRPFFLARPFALFACVAVARQLARWQAGERAGLWMALWLTALVFLSESRMALVIIVLMYPLSFIFRGDRASIGRGMVMAVVGGGALAAGIFFYQPMYDRFFAYDASLNVGGVAVNASGRTAAWNVLLDDFAGSVYLFGRGIGTSSQRVDTINKALGHPHNDFLRYLYDLGSFGVGLYVAFLLAAVTVMWGAVCRAARRRHPDVALHMAPLLALIGFIIAMVTDNPVTYIFVVAPMAVLIGCSLGVMRARANEAAAAAGMRAGPLPPLPVLREKRAELATARERVGVRVSRDGRWDDNAAPSREPSPQPSPGVPGEGVRQSSLNGTPARRDAYRTWQPPNTTLHVLVVGQTPPPLGGQAVMIQRFLEGRYDALELYHVHMAFSREMDEIGRFGYGKVLHLFAVIARIYLARIRRRIDVLYYPPGGSNRAPFYRDTLILLATRWMFKHTVFHFHAGGMSEVIPTLPWPIRPLARLAYRRPDCGIALSELSPPDAVRLGARQTVVVPNGVEDVFETYAADRAARPVDPPRILFVGVLQESKGVMVLLAACAKLAARKVRFHLDLVGKPGSAEFLEVIETFIAGNGLTEHITLRGVLTGADKWRVYANAAVFAFPSHFESENLPVVVLEAMQFELPVVATDWRGIPSIVKDGETGYLCPIRDPGAVAARIEDLLTDADRRQEMAARGRDTFLAKYTTDRWYRSMEAAIVSAASDVRVPRGVAAFAD